MNARDLNLLNHPRQPWQAWPQHLGWGMLGLAVALSLGGWLQAQRTDQQQELQHWRAQLARQTAQHEQALEQRAQQRVQAQRQVFWHKVQTQQHRALALQSVLQAQAGQGLRLWHWQADAQQSVLQGQLPQAEDLPRLQARLGEVGGQPWTLHSLGGVASAPHVSWTLHAPWPAASTPQVAP